MLFFSVMMLLSNLIVFLVTQSDQQVNKTVVVIFTALIGAVLGLPILVFLVFHLYLALTKQTTREVIKKLTHDDGNEPNQWCGVDFPNLDFWEEITEKDAQKLQHAIAQLRGELYEVNATDISSDKH